MICCAAGVQFSTSVTKARWGWRLKSFMQKRTWQMETVTENLVILHPVQLSHFPTATAWSVIQASPADEVV